MHLPCKICFGLFQQLADHVYLAGKYTALKKNTRGNLEMYNIIMKTDCQYIQQNRPTSIFLINCIFFHMWPKNKKYIFLEPIYVPKTSLLGSSPSPSARGGLYYIYPSF